MKNIVGIRFKKPGKVYFFDPGELELNLRDKVIVDTSMGEDVGEVAITKRGLPDNFSSDKLKQVLRVATEKDLKHDKENKEKEKKAFGVCKEKIKKHKLPMNLVDVEFKFDNSKVIFYFTAENRIDFRDLVKDLAAIYKTRIELRQIGVRDEVKRVGGFGVCGRELCCCSFLDNCEGVSIKKAKEQCTSLNPSKISGNCGRLMCCLRYEQNVYEDKNKRIPKAGSVVKTPDGEGTVVSAEILKESVKVELNDGENKKYKDYDVKDIRVIKKAKQEKDVKSDLSEEELKELQNLEKLEREEKKNKKNND